MSGTVRRWPLFLIAAPAAVAIWSGWVGLGQLCGFGIVHPLPGIVPGFELNTAITLPIGVESYGAYALGAWLSSTKDSPARKFAKWSAIGALCLGMLGQVAYHLLSAAHATRAPWPVVVLVSCLPVATLGLAAALTHLLRVPVAEPASVPEKAPAVVSEHTVKRAAKRAAPTSRKRANDRAPVTPESAELAFGAQLAEGTVPSLREVKSTLHLGTERARQIRSHLVLAAGGQS